ncbi:MAG TPA: histidine phosphatase family protein [Mesorhizobium sp.]|nr:histidine phosphatase family protein [Mesorhizobium sp.]
MTTTFFLVRHAAHDNVGGYLAGRKPGVRLGADGHAQAVRLGKRMSRETFSAIIASPRERTQETAQAIARAAGIDTVETDARLDEIDFGAWSGKTFDELNLDPRWARWNAERGSARTPAGEGIADVARRVEECLAEVRARFGEASVVLVSHADVIKTAVCLSLGLKPEQGMLMEVSPASVTVLVQGDWGRKLWQLNETIH